VSAGTAALQRLVALRAFGLESGVSELVKSGLLKPE
jgi:hypothetical protein